MASKKFLVDLTGHLYRPQPSVRGAARRRARSSRGAQPNHLRHACVNAVVSEKPSFNAVSLTVAVAP